MIVAVRGALAPLVGLRFGPVGRAADMLWVQFGETVIAPTSRDPARTTGEYALHMQCPWRVSGSAGVLAGSSDIYVPADPDIDESDFRWDKPGGALGDERLGRWMAAYATAPLVVRAVEVDRCGGFVLRLPHDFAFEAFPNATSAPHDLREQWRLLRPGQDAPHIVLLNQGVE